MRLSVQPRIEQRRFLAEVNTIADVVARLATALDSERRQIADDVFSMIRSISGRQRHADLVQAWVEGRTTD